MTLIDAEDEFAVEQRSGFAGIPEALVQFGQQLAGALQIPLVRLFGMSPAGFSATGESDLRTYYDNIAARQKRDLQGGMNIIYRVAARSAGLELGDNFQFSWVPLWQMTFLETWRQLSCRLFLPHEMRGQKMPIGYCLYLSIPPTWAGRWAGR
jgi:phage-related protein (TIGR01555 family)